MKKYIIAGISVVFVIAALYTAFLFVLPNAVNLNNYKKDIQKIVFDAAKINIDAENIKIVTTPNLAAGVKISGLNAAYPDGEKIASADGVLIRIKLVPLLFKTLELDAVALKNPSVEIGMTEGEFDIIKYLEKEIPASETDGKAASVPVKISEKMPKIVVDGYNVLLKDTKSGNSIKVSGSQCVIDKTVLNRHFRVKTDGRVLFNDKDNINYNVKIDSIMPEIRQSQSAQKSEPVKYDIVNELIKYDIKGNLNADLKIKRALDKTLSLNGFANIDDFSVNIGKEKLPQSYLHLNFDGNKILAESDINISTDEKADIKANITHGRKTAVDLNVKTEKLSFSNILKFVNAIFESFNIPSDLSKMNAQGYIQSDFSLKTDLKNFESNGYFKIPSGSLSYSGLNVNIKDIIADIDFSDNNVNIKKAAAKINGALLNATGTVNSKSVADITLNSEVIPLNSLYTVFAPVDIKKNYDLQSGTVRLNAEIKGKLEDIQPVIALNLDNLKLKDKINGIILSNQNTNIDIKAKSDSFSGLVTLTGTKATMLNPQMRMNVPEINIEIDPNDINIRPFDILLDGSSVNISGDVKNYMEKALINIIIDGTLNASDLKNMLPAEMKNFVSAKGKLPLIAAVTGDLKAISIDAQVKSDAANYFAPVTVQKLLDKPSMVSASLIYANDVINISDIGLYALASSFTKDVKKNLHGALKLAGIDGIVSGLSKTPELKLSVNIADPLLMSLPSMPTASFKTRGHLNIGGCVCAPKIDGFAKISAIGLPDLLTKVQSVDLNFNQGKLNADIQELSLNGSVFNISADAPLNFGNIFVINKISVTSPHVDADKIFKIAERFPQSGPTSAAAVKRPVYPVKILSGEGTIDKFTMGTIAANSISSKFTMENDVLYLNGLKAGAYNGTLEGDVSYDIVTLLAKAKVKGKGIDADSAVSAFMNIKGQLMGTLDLNADVSLKGAEYNEQMKTLKGRADFKITDGQMGSLGRIETFLRADNLLSQSFVNTQLGSLVAALGPYNTGKFSYLNGDMTFSGGYANISYIKSSGQEMALNISGTMNLINSDAKFEILGTLSPDVVAALGPVAELSVENIVSLIPKLGNAISGAMNNYNIQSSAALLEKIPDLTPAKEGTKSFKVVLNGNLMNPPAAVKSFQWLNSANDMQSGKTSLLEALKPAQTAGTEKPVITKEAVKEDIKNQIQQSETVQKIQQNETIQQLNSIFQMYKDAKQKEEAVKQEQSGQVPELQTQ